MHDRDIDLLKVRSFAVVHRCVTFLVLLKKRVLMSTYSFTDEQVLDPRFKHELARVCKVAQPLVRLYVHSFDIVFMLIGGRQVERHDDNSKR